MYRYSQSFSPDLYLTHGESHARTYSNTSIHPKCHILAQQQNIFCSLLFLCPSYIEGIPGTGKYPQLVVHFYGVKDSGWISINHIMSQPFSALHCWRVNQHGCTLGSSKRKTKEWKALLLHVHTDRTSMWNLKMEISHTCCVAVRLVRHIFCVVA